VRRRPLLPLLLAGVLPLAAARAFAQAGPAPRRIGVLGIGSVAGGGGTTARDLLEGLRRHGLVEGRDFVLDERWAGGRAEGLAALAAQLVALKPALLLTAGPQATQAALDADAKLPVVATLGEVIGLGFAAQLGRPGGRLTGVSFLGTPLNAKRLELLAELLPKGSAVLNLGDPAGRSDVLVEAIAATAHARGLVSHTLYAATAQEIDRAFASARRLRVAGLNVLGSPLLHGNRAQIMELAAKAQLPAVYQWPQTAREGGLMAYGPNVAAMRQQVAGLVARVLGGARAGDLPIEQPTKFELVINLKTAKALGTAIPQALLLRADEVIQ
jgi:putative tryptophan/tyrosine transport system substrate-binding protein